MGALLFSAAPIDASTENTHPEEDEYTGKATADTINVNEVRSQGSASHSAGPATGDAHADHSNASQSTHAPSGHETQDAHSSHAAQTEHQAAGKSHTSMAGHVEVKPVPVTLADGETMNILRTNWLKETKEADLSAERAKLSGTFWTVMAFLACLTILGLILFAGGIFKRRRKV